MQLDDLPDEVLKTMPRNDDGDVVIDEYRSPDGTTVRACWNEVEGYKVVLEHEDFEYLKTRIQNLLPDIPGETTLPN
jgi:hypothetical protein